MLPVQEQRVFEICCICNESGLKLCCNSLSCSCYDNKKICLSCQNKKCSNKVDRRLETVEKPITSADIKCGCGINQKNEVKKNVCEGSRCLCYKKGIPCIGCSCKNCNNPFGKSELKTTNTRTKTERKTLYSEGNKLPRKTSEKWLIEKGFSIFNPKWTTQEKIVLHHVMQALASDTSTSKQLTNLYNHIILFNQNLEQAKLINKLPPKRKNFSYCNVKLLQTLKINILFCCLIFEIYIMFFSIHCIFSTRHYLMHFIII